MPDFDWLEEELEQRRAQGLLRQRKVSQTSPAAETHSGNFSSNDYLGLSHHPEILAAVQQPLKATSPVWGSGASPLVTGYSPLHQKLEEDLATFENKEAALVFTSGFAANIGILSALFSNKDCIYADHFNHASLIDGMRYSGAKFKTYKHHDLQRLEEQLKQGSDNRKRVIVTDSIFSMDGDLAPLDALAELADKYDAFLMIDEAHGTGVFGENGRGVAEHFGVSERIDLHMGTLSKALGSIGGFIAAKQTVIDYLVNFARSYVYSTALPPAAMAAGSAALRIIENEPERRETLLANAAKLRTALTDQGWDIGNSESQIIPVIVGDAEKALQLAEKVNIPAIRPPTVPEGTARLRISLSYDHTESMIDGLIKQFAAVKAEA